MSSKNIRRKRQIFTTFLKERGLNQIYRRYIRLKGRRRKSTIIAVGGETRPVVAYRTKDRILFRNPKTLAVVSSTRKIKRLIDVPQFFKVTESDRKNYLGIDFKNVRFRNKRNKSGWDTKSGIIKPQFRRTDVRREIFKNSIHYETMRPLENKVGKIFIKVRFIRNNNETYDAEGGSRKNRLLTDRDERQESFMEAFEGALSTLPFYDWKSFEILHLRFFYKQPKTFEKLVFA